MKQLVLVLFVLVSGFVAQAQETENRSVGSFSGIKVSEGIDVYLIKGDKETLKIELTGDADLKDVLTEVSGSYLKIHMASGSYRKTTVKVYVTYVKLEKLSASSAGSIFYDQVIKADRMEISASSAGNIEVGLDVNMLDLSASSAGEVEVKGKAKSLNIDASSAGEIDAYDLEAESVDAEASSAGSLKINATKALTAHASSGGSIRYRGNPDKSITESSSGGSVKKSS